MSAHKCTMCDQPARGPLKVVITFSNGETESFPACSATCLTKVLEANVAISRQMG